jgi:hypothetical protein
MDVFDAAPMNQSCAARARTTVAPQALALFNGEFARASARQFALRLQREAGDDPGSQVSLAFRLAFTRSPTQDEQARAVKFLQEQAKEHPAGATAAFIDFCHVLLNANELVYPD